MVLEPAVLGFEAKEPPLLHDHEEHDQGLLLVDKRPSAMRASRLMLPKAFKQRKQQLDSIGFSIFRFYKSPLLNEKGVA
jgi:hypothetical protein